MREVKYTVIYHNDEDICDIIVEDGGVAAVHVNEDGLQLSLYKDRLNGWHHYCTSFFDEFGPYGIKPFGHENLSDGEVSAELISAALGWLYISTDPIEFKEVKMEDLFN